MGSIPKPKRTVTIQMGPHITVVDNLGNKEPKLNVNSKSPSPMEQRKDNECAVTLNRSAANKNHDSRKLSREGSTSTTNANVDSEGLTEVLAETEAQTGQCRNEMREVRRKNCKKMSREEPSLPTSPKDDLCVCDGALKVQDCEDITVDPNGVGHRFHTSTDFHKCEANSVLTQMSKEMCSPKKAASGTQMLKQGEADGTGIQENLNMPVPVKSEGADYTMLSGQTSNTEVHHDNLGQHGCTKVETLLLQQHEGNSGHHITSASSHNTKPTDMKKKQSLVYPQQELHTQKDLDSSTHPHPSVLSQTEPATPRGHLYKLMPTLTKGGPQSTDSFKEEMQHTQRNLNEHFKEAATMTTTPEHSQISRRKCRDAEVQAVIEVCCRSAATSPHHILVAAPPEVCYAVIQGSKSSSGVCQMFAGSQPEPHLSRDDPSFKEGQVCSDTSVQIIQSASNQVNAHDPERTRMGDILYYKPNAGFGHLSGSVVHQDMELGARPKEPRLHLGRVQKEDLLPVDQINIAACGQANHVSNSSFHGKELQTDDCQDFSLLESHDDNQTGNLHETSKTPKSSTSNHVHQVLADIVSLPDKSASPPATLKQGCQLHVKTDVESHQVESNMVERNTKQKDSPNKVKSKPESDLCSKPVPSLPKKSCQQGTGVAEQDACIDDGNNDTQDKSQAVPEVVWDEKGMTWEVYGASVDPESLGFAIQSHLLCKIKEHEKQIQTQTIHIRKSLSSESPKGKKTKRRPRHVFRSLLQNVRRPKCCECVPPSVLD